MREIKRRTTFSVQRGYEGAGSLIYAGGDVDVKRVALIT